MIIHDKSRAVPGTYARWDANYGSRAATVGRSPHNAESQTRIRNHSHSIYSLATSRTPSFSFWDQKEPGHLQDDVARRDCPFQHWCVQRNQENGKPYTKNACYKKRGFSQRKFRKIQSEMLDGGKIFSVHHVELELQISKRHTSSGISLGSPSKI